MNDEKLHDYTEVVIEVWEAYLKAGYNLSSLGGGDSRAGIDYISWKAEDFLKLVRKEEKRGYWWDGWWIDAVLEYASFVASQQSDPFNGKEFDVTKYMESPDTNPDVEGG